MSKPVRFILFILIFTVLISGCSAKTEVNEDSSITDTAEFKTDIEKNCIPDNAFRFSQSRNAIESFESYLHEKGTSSVNSRVLVYRYDDYLIISAAYFNCGNGKMETFFLTADQGEVFFELVHNYTKSDSADAQDEDGMLLGGNYSLFELRLDGEAISVEPLPLDQLNLSLKEIDIHEINTEESINISADSESYNSFADSSYAVYHSYSLFDCISDQINDICGEYIQDIESITVGKEESQMDVLLTDGETRSILVTNNACVIGLK